MTQTNTTQNKEELNKCLHEHLTCPGDITTIKCAYCGKTMYKQEPEKWEKEFFERSGIEEERKRIRKK